MSVMDQSRFQLPSKAKQWYVKPFCAISLLGRVVWGKFLICCAGVERSMKTHQQVEDLRQTIDIFCTGFRTSLVAGGG